MNSGKGPGVSVNPLYVSVSDKKEVVFACGNCMAYFMSILYSLFRAS